MIRKAVIPAAGLRNEIPSGNKINAKRDVA